jgi:hypothetical protein
MMPGDWVRFRLTGAIRATVYYRSMIDGTPLAGR